MQKENVVCDTETIPPKTKSKFELKVFNNSAYEFMNTQENTMEIQLSFTTSHLILISEI